MPTSRSKMILINLFAVFLVSAIIINNSQGEVDDQGRIKRICEKLRICNKTDKDILIFSYLLKKENCKDFSYNKGSKIINKLIGKGYRCDKGKTSGKFYINKK